MADIDRDYTDRNRTERERVYAVNSGGSAGWWIGGVLVLAVLIIGFIALSGGEPAPVDTAPTTVENNIETAPPATEAAPAQEPAAMTEAPAQEAAPAAEEAAPATDAAPEEAAPVEAAPAEEGAPAEAAPAAQ